MLWYANTGSGDRHSVDFWYLVVYQYRNIACGLWVWKTSCELRYHELCGSLQLHGTWPDILIWYAALNYTTVTIASETSEVRSLTNEISNQGPECICLKSLDGLSPFEVPWNCPDLQRHGYLSIWPSWTCPWITTHGSQPTGQIVHVWIYMELSRPMVIPCRGIWPIWPILGL